MQREDIPYEPWKEYAAPIILKEHYRLQQSLRRQRLHKRVVNRQCTFCGSVGLDKRRCSLCKSVRYCDEQCQRADYIACHRQECADFTHPPFTTAFTTEPISALTNCIPATILARGHRDGVGCWLSVRGTPNAILMDLTSSLFPKQWEGRFMDEMLTAALTGSGRADELLPYHAPCLLALQVLVQNRRKDGEPVLFLAAHSRAVSSPDDRSVRLAMQRQRGLDAPSTYVDEDLRLRATLRVARSDLDKKPRIYVANFDGAPQVLNARQHPPAVLNAGRGIVVLQRGQFAVLHLQFCVGDGSIIKKEWQALRCLEHFCISPWDGRDAESHDQDGMASPRAVAIECAIDAEAVEEYYRRDIISGELNLNGDMHNGN
ncbi:hypothetical protein C8T65DRAFT_644433 [Cerioporus squamosus]|nr:hypothetical protein C8T65DRAFT_644433 [Cerioporus squamosus]